MSLFRVSLLITMSKPLYLILCTGNSCRSQMGEELLRMELGDEAEVASAGCCPSGYVHPLAIKAMAELGRDISAYESKSHDLYLDQDVRAVITVCDYANTECPTFPGQMERHHWPFFDPADAEGSEEEKLEVFRKVRDEISLVMKAYVAGLRSAREAAGVL